MGDNLTYCSIYVWVKFIEFTNFYRSLSCIYVQLKKYLADKKNILALIRLLFVELGFSPNQKKIHTLKYYTIL